MKFNALMLNLHCAMRQLRRFGKGLVLAGWIFFVVATRLAADPSVEGLKTTGCGCFDGFQSVYVFTVGKGFDPSKSYFNLYLKTWLVLQPGGVPHNFVDTPYRDMDSGFPFYVQDGLMKRDAVVTNTIYGLHDAWGCGSGFAAPDVWACPNNQFMRPA